ncbi:MAG TPA: hypothetical protein ACQGQF_03625, partial [Xylella fastidiosa subsp. pauca]
MKRAPCTATTNVVAPAAAVTAKARASIAIGTHHRAALWARNSTSIQRREAPDSSAQKRSVARGDCRRRRCCVPPVGAWSTSVSQSNVSVYSPPGAKVQATGSAIDGPPVAPHVGDDHFFTCRPCQGIRQFVLTEHNNVVDGARSALPCVEACLQGRLLLFGAHDLTALQDGRDLVMVQAGHTAAVVARRRAKQQWINVITV